MSATDGRETPEPGELPTRRDALRWLGAGASAAMGALAGCTRQPLEVIVPAARSPEAAVPGRPRWFATAMPWPSGALGLLVESHGNRPTKIEGNPDHPASLGATDAIAQAQVLDLYDPDRSQVVLRAGRPSTWDAFVKVLRDASTAQTARRGAGLRILTGSVTSPTLAAQLEGLSKAMPLARWHAWEPVNRDRARAGALLAFGRDVIVAPKLDAADVIVALDADFLDGGPASVRLARDFAARRRVRARSEAMNRLYVAEASPSLTGAKADHRLPLRPSEIVRLAFELERELETRLAGAPARGGDPRTRFLRAAADDLVAHRGRSLLLAGERMPAEVHALVHRWNARLGNAGRTVAYRPPIARPDVEHEASLRELVGAMTKGEVELLLLLGVNPVHAAPAELDFAGALARVPLRIHLGLYDDETAQRCDWHVNEAHFLESWGDTLAADGTASIVQPLIAPLHGGRTAHELVAMLAHGEPRSAHDLVRDHWRERSRDGFELAWRRALRDGFVDGTAVPEETPAPSDAAASSATASAAAPAANGALELELRPDPFVHDGRFANNGWLQELGRPISKIAWDNSAFVSVATAARLGVARGDVVALRRGAQTLRAPVFVLPGQADGCVTLPLGYGRARAGRFGTGVGANAAVLRSSEAAPLELVRTGDRHEFALPQEHDQMEGRDPVRRGTLEQFQTDASRFGRSHAHGEHASLLPEPNRGERAWGMVIDLGVCTGCSACVVACQSENNIPIVGKDEVARGRTLHWIRVDRYFDGDPANPSIFHQPLPCMHCEHAPCEVVCPVGATVHGSEGLNEMVYNRCVGTRYCANNCPYKVRRFNFFDYHDREHELLALQRNPDVTVRSRGVMEKCTYCVQRINQARIAADREGRDVRDGEVVTACQGVCPVQAIVFGDLEDGTSAVARLQTEPHRYSLLDELGTRPRTTYLARIDHPRENG